MDALELLKAVYEHKVSAEDALSRLKYQPFVDLGYAKIDTQRALRQGQAEVVFCQGKSDEHLLAVFEAILERENSVLGTRADDWQAQIVQEKFPKVTYDPLSRILKQGGASEHKGLIAVCTAGTADIRVAEECAQTAEFFGSKVERFYDVGVSGIHRLLAVVPRLQEATVVVAVAGMEGALGSVLGGLVAAPVIAVPTSVGYGANFHGLSALLTMLNSCSNGVCTVNIDNGYGAGYLSHQINRQSVKFV